MSTADELNKLADLLERGLLTEDEFKAQKAQILSGSPATDAPAQKAPAPARPKAPAPREKTKLELEKEQQAKTLVMWSHILGWGGLGLMVLSVVLFVTLRGGAEIAGYVVGFGFVSALVGGIIGQVGRGMQGRAI